MQHGARRSRSASHGLFGRAALQIFGLRMSLSENRFPLFRDMR
jgi:hypothetical protein